MINDFIDTENLKVLINLYYNLNTNCRITGRRKLISTGHTGLTDHSMTRLQ